MLRQGSKVAELTKKAGQPPRVGKITAVHDENSVEIEWEDGHTSVVSKGAVTPVKRDA